jgi:hypothetical protein
MKQTSELTPFILCQLSMGSWTMAALRLGVAQSARMNGLSGDPTMQRRHPA